MKKVFLFSLVMCLSLAVIAQTSITPQKVSARFDRSEVIAPEKNISGPASYDQPSTFTKSVAGRDLTFVPLGGSGNAYGFYSNPRTYLWADPNINAVAFVHRMLVEAGTYGNSRIAYDVSWEGGANGTWTNNIQVYEPTGPGTTYPDAAGRYPQGGIFNPPGNTDPDNAYFAYFIPTLDGSNTCGANNWGGFGYGVNQLTAVNPPAPTQTNLTSGGDFWHLIPDAYTITQTGHAWMVDGNQPCDAGAFTYDGNVYVAHGVWDAGANDLVYEEYLIPALGYADGINDVKVAFAPDGMVGYICIMSDAVSDPQDFNGYHPILLKTTDGGENWSDPVHVLLGGYDGIESIKYFWPDENISAIDIYAAGFERDEVWYNMGFQVDMAVDAYGNPHITGLITVAVPDGWYPQAGLMATWHVFSNDGGETFDAVPLYENLWFDGDLGGITQYNRPQISTTLNGKFLFISCIDTDFEGLEDNTQPDIFCCSYDIDNNEYTDMVNVTQFTQAWLVAWEGSQSHYVFSELDGNTLTCTVPFAYTELDPANAGNPVGFWYVDGWTYQFTVTSQFQPPTNLAAAVLCSDVTLTWTAPGTTPLGYNVYRNNVKINADPITVLTYTDAGLTAGSYSYKVTAVYSGGESEPTTTIGASVESLDPVSSLVLDNEPGTPDVTVSWTAPARVLDGYNVYRNGVKLNAGLITGLSYEDTGLENGEYTYCVTAVYQGVCESEQVCGEESIVISVGIKELENSFMLYPNPARGMLNMEFNTEVQMVRILNDMGMVVYTNEQVSQSKVLRVNVSAFDPGIYFVQVRTATGMAAKKLTVH